MSGALSATTRKGCALGVLRVESAPKVLSQKSVCARAGRRREDRRDARHDLEDERADLLGVLRDRDEQRDGFSDTIDVGVIALEDHERVQRDVRAKTKNMLT